MSLQNLVQDVKTRVSDINTRRHKAAKVSLDSLRQANQIVVDQAQALLASQKATSKDLLASAKSGLSKARADGLKAVLAAPASYLPARDKLNAAVADARVAFTKTYDGLTKVAKDGYAAVRKENTSETVKKAARKVGTTTKKAATKASKAVKVTAVEAKA
ncbi:MAG TPA: hypothetical protein VFQ88_10805 [Nevskiaceae bacterium]|nr:hypothetical protein [Nevskiaceae bacterium]